jgi:uncharacterized protein
MGGDLYRRLEALRKEKAAPKADTEYRESTGGSTGDRSDTGGLQLPGFRRHGRYLYLKEEKIPACAVGVSLGGYFLPDPVQPEKVGFYDLETTGLSSGTGTIAFLVGWAVRHNDTLTLIQAFLSDYPGESEFLNYIAASWSDLDALVSYNGLAFDIAVLRSRSILNGIRLPSLRQADLLYATRALWKNRLESCSLDRIEREILGVERTNDIGGAEVPERYFRFHRTGNPDLVLPVFEHHRQDILSLVLLHAELEQILTGTRPNLLDQNVLQPDMIQTARLLSADRKPGIRSAVGEPETTSLEEKQRAGKILEDIVRSGYCPSAGRAARYLSRLYKTTHNTEKSIKLWFDILSSSKKNGFPDTHAAIEVAKYLEHKKKDYPEAARIVSQVLPVLPAGSRQREQFLLRLRRLEKKMAR